MERYFLIFIVIILSFGMTSCRSDNSGELSSEIEFVTSEIWIEDSETKSEVESNISDKNVISKNEFHNYHYMVGNVIDTSGGVIAVGYNDIEISRNKRSSSIGINR